MKILVFTEGTCLIHGLSKGKTREQIVRDNLKFKSEGKGKIIPGNFDDFAGYIPAGSAVEIIRRWKDQGAIIYYLTSRRTKEEIEDINNVLKKFNFPDFQNLLFRKEKEDYKDVAQNLMPDIFIEDDCESIGGTDEMTSTHFDPEAKSKIHTIVIKEFQGIDHLPNDINELIDS